MSTNEYFVNLRIVGPSEAEFPTARAGFYNFFIKSFLGKEFQCKTVWQ